MSIIINTIEKSQEEPIIHFDKIYTIHDELVVSQDSTNKLSFNKNLYQTNMNCITNKDDVIQDNVGVIQNNVKRPSISQITSHKIEDMDRYSSRDSDLVTVDGINDPLIKNKKTYWNSFDCSFDCIFCCC